jgi:hypothetical protein
MRIRAPQATLLSRQNEPPEKHRTRPAFYHHSVFLYAEREKSNLKTRDKARQSGIWRSFASKNGAFGCLFPGGLRVAPREGPALRVCYACSRQDPYRKFSTECGWRSGLKRPLRVDSILFVIRRTRCKSTILCSSISSECVSNATTHFPSLREESGLSSPKFLKLPRK